MRRSSRGFAAATARTMPRVPDPIFANPRLARLYDHLDPDRSDLDVYFAMVEEFGARQVIDVGCGTGTFACLLAAGGIDVVGLDPAEASLDVARGKPGAERVRWVLGDTSRLPSLASDVATMTGNVAQVFLHDDEFSAVLGDLRRALRPGGRVVFETRDPTREAWRSWNRGESHTRTVVPGAGAVTSWVDVLDVSLPLVTFRWTYLLEHSGDVLTSDSTLCFRNREAVEACIARAGLVVDEVRDAPDRPGLEFVFICRREPE